WAWSRSRRVPDVNADFLGGSLFAIASVGLGLGVGVIVAQTGIELDAPGSLALVAAGVALGFALLYRFLVRTLVLAVSAIISAIAAYYALVGMWMQHSQSNWDGVLFATASMLLGLLVMGLAYVVKGRALLSRLSNGLYELGAFGVLASTFDLTFNDMHGSTVWWDVLYPLVLAAGVWASVRLSSRAILTWTTIFLTLYMFKISFVYFKDVLGGSLALCLAGVLVIGMAYGATRFAKRYITSSKP
ncbi:MAG TPA: hypothetical protein VFK47_18155, partial [Ktedonobacteraceae bacterium]|nr:hypothetical protein [Ktedonobacteraceae bacterium]